METTLKQLGNSKAFIISKKIREELNLGDKVHFEVLDQQLVIKSVQKPREGWGNEFKKMNMNKDDILLCDDILDDDEVLSW